MRGSLGTLGIIGLIDAFGTRGTIGPSLSACRRVLKSVPRRSLLPCRGMSASNGKPTSSIGSIKMITKRLKKAIAPLPTICVDIYASTRWCFRQLARILSAKWRLTRSSHGMSASSPVTTRSNTSRLTKSSRKPWCRALGSLLPHSHESLYAAPSTPSSLSALSAPMDFTVFSTLSAKTDADEKTTLGAFSQPATPASSDAGCQYVSVPRSNPRK